MKPLGVSFLLAVLAARLLAAQAPRPVPWDTSARAVLGLEDGWASGLVRRDSAFFGQLLADGFIYSENDHTYSRREVLHDLFADTVKAAHNEEMLVHPFGSTAVVTGWLVMTGRGANGAFDRRYRFTDVWMRQGKRWRIVAAHDYLMPTPKGELK